MKICILHKFLTIPIIHHGYTWNKIVDRLNILIIDKFCDIELSKFDRNIKPPRTSIVDDIWSYSSMGYTQIIDRIKLNKDFK